MGESWTAVYTEQCLFDEEECNAYKAMALMVDVGNGMRVHVDRRERAQPAIG